MKLIKPSVEYIPQDNSVDGMYRHIERCGRICYKSEDKISEYSHNDFVGRMIKSGHTAMLEHGTVYLFYSGCCYDHEDMAFASKYESNPYTKGGFIGTDDNEISSDGKFYDIMGNPATGNMQFCFTTNFRVLVENRWLEDFKYICEPTEHHKRRYTMKFITDIGVCRELLRHRVFSFANESTRYCNYSKDKFDNEVTFVVPCWYTHGNGSNDRECSMDSEFENCCRDSEQSYLRMIQWGAKPQEARQILPLATKTELIMTGFEDDWRHFFDLRLRGTTGKPHPDMLVVAELAWNEFKDKLNLEL